MVAEITRDEADAQPALRVAIVGEGAAAQQRVRIAAAVGQSVGGIFLGRNIGRVELGEQAVGGDEQLRRVEIEGVIERLHGLAEAPEGQQGAAAIAVCAGIPGLQHDRPLGMPQGFAVPEAPLVDAGDVGMRDREIGIEFEGLLERRDGAIVIAPVGQDSAKSAEEQRIFGLAVERDADQVVGQLGPVRPGRDGAGEIGCVRVGVVEEDHQIEQGFRGRVLVAIVMDLRGREGAFDEGRVERPRLGAEALNLVLL